MILTVERFNFTDKSTIGSLAIDGKSFCWTLELPLGDGGPGSAIPVGTYKVVTYPSPKFGRLMPLLVGVPGRSNIEMHWGNEPENTEGCILLGNSMPGKDFIGDSRQAFDDFWEQAQGPLEAGECTITVK
jgi:hypothetical protein